jgi:hypothetical protein
MTLFNTDIAGLIKQAFTGKLRQGVVRRVTNGARDPLDPLAGLMQSFALYPFEGVVTDTRFTNEEGITYFGKEVLIISKSISVEPVPGDIIEIDGNVFTIQETMKDPAYVSITCKVV